jgi:hypothetical protein
MIPRAAFTAPDAKGNPRGRHSAAVSATAVFTSGSFAVSLHWPKNLQIDCLLDEVLEIVDDSSND